MSVSGAELTALVLVGASFRGTDYGGIVSIETRRAEERLRSAGSLSVSINMSYETLIIPDALYRTL
jgi:hypothetical protein